MIFRNVCIYVTMTGMGNINPSGFFLKFRLCVCEFASTLNMSLINVIKRTVTEKLHTNGIMPTTDVIENVMSIGGGCISEAYLCNINSGKKIFVKTCQCSSEQSLEQVVQMFARFYCHLLTTSMLLILLKIAKRRDSRH